VFKCSAKVLYIRTVIYDVYNLGAGGDEVAALSAGAVRGELRISRRFPASPLDTSRMATLCEPGTRKELLRPMVIVGDVRMNEHSMVIEGTVVVGRSERAKAKVERYAVRWLCKFPGAPAVLNTEKLRERREKLKADMSRDGFHKAYDDIADEQATYGPLDNSIGP
jgi:hypothetical protein